ncbi:hypothetical protein ACQR0V_01245 [Bradyrhizobium sp. HKCCYLS2058]|uniref:hypothetical protein n=1 Tax=unclassified Bradyrhizobium TaxID=2631580 RepID=UPI003EC0545C
MAYPVITPPGSLAEAIATVATLSDADFEALLTATSTPRSFSLSDAQVEVLKKQIPLLENNIPYVLSALSFLYSKVDGLRKSSGTDVVGHLLEELDLEEPEIVESLRPRLEQLLRENIGYNKYRKVRRLRTGLLPNAVSFRTMLDLRPDFGDGDELEFRGWVRIIQFRVTTDSDDPSKREFVFQLDDDSLPQLIKAIDRLKRKLEAIEQNDDIAASILENSQ